MVADDRPTRSSERPSSWRASSRLPFGFWLVLAALTIVPIATYGLAAAAHSAAKDQPPPPCEDPYFGCVFDADPADEAQSQVLMLGLVIGVLMLGVGALHLARERRGAPPVTAADRGLAVVLATGGLVLMLLAAWAAGASSGGLILLAAVHGLLLTWAVSVATGASRAGGGG